jgi:hypothetical protein
MGRTLQPNGGCVIGLTNKSDIKTNDTRVPFDLLVGVTGAGLSTSH